MLKRKVELLKFPPIEEDFFHLIEIVNKKLLDFYVYIYIRERQVFFKFLNKFLEDKAFSFKFYLMKWLKMSLAISFSLLLGIRAFYRFYFLRDPIREVPNNNQVFVSPA